MAKIYAKRNVEIDIDGDGEKEEVTAFLLKGTFVLKLRKQPPEKIVETWRKTDIKPGVTANIAVLKPDHKGKRGGRTVLTSIWYDLDHLAEVAPETRRLILELLKSIPENKRSEEQNRALSKFKRMKLKEGVNMLEVKNIPISRLKWLNRPREREKLPADYFLMPKERKFPWRNKDGSVNCNLLRAAIVRAAQHNHPEVEKKARELYQQYCKKEENDYSYVSEVELEDVKDSFWHNILPFGEFIDPRYGKIQITKEFCEKIVDNFKKGIPSYEPPLTINHDDNLGRYGFIEDLEVRDDGLWAKIKLSDEGMKLLEDEKFVYLSAEYMDNYLDKKTGKSVGPVIIGVSLVNRPGHPGMKPIEFYDDITHEATTKKWWDFLSFSKKFEDILTEEEAEKFGIDCVGCANDDVKELEEVEEVEVKELQDKIVALEDEKAKLTEKVKELSDALSKKENELSELKGKLEEMSKKLYASEVENWAKDWLQKGAVPSVVEEAKKIVLEKPELKEFADKLLEQSLKPELTKQLGEVEEDPTAVIEKQAEMIAKLVSNK